MKNYYSYSILIILACITLFASGCASNIYPGGPTPAGFVYTGVTSPAQELSIALNKEAKPIKKGSSSAVGVLGLFAFGDAGLDAAMEDANIKKVHHVDHTVRNFLFIFNSDTTIVYGE